MNALTTPTALNELTLLTTLPHSGLASTPSGQRLAKQAEMGRSLRHLLAKTCCWFVWTTLALTSPLSHAVETSAAAASALKVLSMPLTETRGNSAATSGVTSTSGLKSGTGPASSELSITVQKGESIDAVIRRGFPRLPLRDDFMRHALAKANPKIFPKGQTYPVKTGTVLKLPSLDDLRQMITVLYPDMLLLMQKPSDEISSDSTSRGLDQRQWVRFP